MRGKYTWFVSGYYNDEVKPPKLPWTLAIKVGGLTREALAMDIEALKGRDDIGKVVLTHPNSHEERL